MVKDELGKVIGVDVNEIPTEHVTVFAGFEPKYKSKIPFIQNILVKLFGAKVLYKTVEAKAVQLKSEDCPAESGDMEITIDYDDDSYDNSEDDKVADKEVLDKIKEIAEYIFKKYPTAYVCEKYRIDDFDDEWAYTLIPDLIDFFHYEKLNWCGCGSPWIAKGAIRDYLVCVSKQTDWDDRKEAFQKAFGVDSAYDNPLLLCLAYALDAAEFTEHGSGIGGAWATKDGEYYLWLLQHNEELE